MKTWLATAALAALALMACVPAASARSCVTNYRSLPSSHGWRHYNVVDGRHCWYVGSAHHRHESTVASRPPPHRSAPLRSKPATMPIIETPPIIPAAAPAVGQPPATSAFAMEITEGGAASRLVYDSFLSMAERDLLPTEKALPLPPQSMVAVTPPQPADHPSARTRAIAIGSIAWVAVTIIAVLWIVRLRVGVADDAES